MTTTVRRAVWRSSVTVRRERTRTLVDIKKLADDDHDGYNVSIDNIPLGSQSLVLFIESMPGVLGNAHPAGG